MQNSDAKLFYLIHVLLLLILQIIQAKTRTFGQFFLYNICVCVTELTYRPLIRINSASRLFFFCLFIVETEVPIVLHALFNIDLLQFI